MRDKYGFTLANFNHMDGAVHSDSFAFPLHCQQVFFSDDPHRRGWKVVCKTDVRGRRGAPQFAQSTSTVFNVGNNADFTGLLPPTVEVDPMRVPSVVGGQHIRAAGRGMVQQQGT